MKFIEALEMGVACGLNTVTEAVRNVEIHSTNLFIYEKISSEFKELYLTWDESGCPPEMETELALRICTEKEKK